ncbi:lasso peptide biosynthesis B2 protein [Microcoleus sp. ZQ-A2]|nr:lasso peptide biosynthesis B2 protein [Microcoleus sp. FACHB-1]
MASFHSLLIRAIKQPRDIWLCLWAFGRLWWVDRHLQSLAVGALKTPFRSTPELLSQDLLQEIERRVTVIAWTAKHHLCRPQCLHRSLVLYLWLKSQGISPQLEVGWSNEIGHAWVSYQGQILNDNPAIRKSTPPLMKL